MFFSPFLLKIKNHVIQMIFIIISPNKMEKVDKINKKAFLVAF